MLNKKGEVQCIDDEILEKMSLKHRYNFLNNNLMSILKPNDFNFLKQAQKFFLRFEKKKKSLIMKISMIGFPRLVKKV